MSVVFTLEKPKELLQYGENPPATLSKALEGFGSFNHQLVYKKYDRTIMPSSQVPEVQQSGQRVMAYHFIGLTDSKASKAFHVLMSEPTEQEPYGTIVGGFVDWLDDGDIYYLLEVNFHYWNSRYIKK